MNQRRAFQRMAREMDALTADVLSEDASAPVRVFVRLAARWWAVQRWWLFHVSWSRPAIAMSPHKRRTVALHAESGAGHPTLRAALDRVAQQCIRFDLERRVRASERPERWYGADEWQRVQERERRAREPLTSREADARPGAYPAHAHLGIALPHTVGTFIR